MKQMIVMSEMTSDCADSVQSHFTTRDFIFYIPVSQILPTIDSVKPTGSPLVIEVEDTEELKPKDGRCGSL